VIPIPIWGLGGTGTHYCLGANLARMEIDLISRRTRIFEESLSAAPGGYDEVKIREVARRARCGGRHAVPVFPVQEAPAGVGAPALAELAREIVMRSPRDLKSRKLHNRAVLGSAVGTGSVTSYQHDPGLSRCTGRRSGSPSHPDG
jgi:hypothetical protein